MESDSDYSARVVAAMDARDHAKRRYEQLRNAYKKREISLNEVNQALMAYVVAQNEYHELLAEARRIARPSPEGD